MEDLLVLFDFENTLVQRNYEVLAKSLCNNLIKLASELKDDELDIIKLKISPSCEAIEKKEEDKGNHKIFCTKILEHYKKLRKIPDLECDIDSAHILFNVIREIQQEELKKCYDKLNSEKLFKVCQSVTGKEECIVAGWDLFDDLEETLKALKCKAGAKIALISTSNIETISKIVQFHKIDSYIDKIFTKGEQGEIAGKGTALEMAVNFYKEFKRYQICHIGDMIESDIVLGKKLNLRTLWMTQHPWCDERNVMTINKTTEENRIHFAFSRFNQLIPLLQVIKKDIAFLCQASEEVQRTFLDRKARKEALPSEKLLKVAYLYPEEKIRSMAERKFITCNEKLLFYPLQIKASLEEQGPFDAILHKGTEIMVDEFVIKKSKYFSLLQDYSARNSKTMVTIDPLEAIKMTLFRTDTNDKLDKALHTPLLQSVMAKHGIQMKVPYYKTLKNNNVSDSLNTIKKDIENKLCNYSFIVKLSESCETWQAHTLAIVTNEEGLVKTLSNDIYKGQELIVQQLIKHHMVLYKLYAVGEDYLSYFSKKSLPSVLPIDSYAIFDSQRPFPKEWFSGKEEIVDKLNKEFAFEITKGLLREIDLSLIGIDYVIEEGTGNYYVLDLNYNSSYRHEKDLGEKITHLILKRYSEKVKKI